MDTSEKHICTQCKPKQAFSSKRTLKTHRVDWHDNECTLKWGESGKTLWGLREPDNLISCSFCAMRFQTFTHWKKHSQSTHPPPTFKKEIKQQTPAQVKLPSGSPIKTTAEKTMTAQSPVVVPNVDVPMQDCSMKWGDEGKVLWAIASEDGSWTCAFCEVMSPTIEAWEIHTLAAHPPPSSKRSKASMDPVAVDQVAPVDGDLLQAESSVSLALPRGLSVGQTVTTTSWAPQPDDAGTFLQDSSADKTLVGHGVHLGSTFVNGAMKVLEGVGEGLYSSASLFSQRIAVNDRCGLIICCQHEVAVEEGQLVQHLERLHHTGTKNAKALLKDATTLLAGCGPVEASPYRRLRANGPQRKPLAPVTGLPVLDGFQCTGCGACGVGVTFEKNHFSSVNRNRCTSTREEAKVFRQQVQQLYNSRPYVIFPVSFTRDGHCPTPHEPNALLSALNSLENAVKAKAADNPTSSTDPARTHPFNAILQWNQLHENRPKQDLLASIKLPFAMTGNNFQRRTPRLGFLRERTVDVLRWGWDNRSMDSRFFLYLKAIGMGDGSLSTDLKEQESTSNHQRSDHFNPGLQTKTIDKYGRIACMLLAQVLRTAPEPEDYKPSTRPASYDPSFESVLDGPVAYDEEPPKRMPMDDFAFSDNQLRAASTARRALQCELDGYLHHVHGQAGAALLRAKHAQETLAHASRLALMELAESIFLRSFGNGRLDPGDCALERFTICLALAPRGGYIEANVLEQHLAALEFFARSTVLVKLLRQASANEGVHDPNFLKSGFDDDITDGLTKFVSAHGFHCTPFSKHRSSSYIVKDLRAHLPPMDKIVWLPSHESFGAATVSGKLFSVDALRHGLQPMIAAAKSSFNELLLGVDVTKILPSDFLGVNSETYASDKVVGSCFLDDPANHPALGFHPEEHSIHCHLDREGRLDEFLSVSKVHGGTLNPNRARIRKYLKDATALQDLLLALVHLTTIPGRATEIASQRLRRDADDAPCLKVVGRHLCVRTLKNKNGLWAIGRFPAPEVAKLLVQYLLTVRRFEVLLTRVSDGEERANDRHLAMWVSADSKPYTDVNVRNAINVALPRWFGVPLTWRDLRQFYTAITSRYFDIKIDEEDVFTAEPNQAIVAGQMGHGVDTHLLHYGKDAGTWDKVREGKTEGWIRVSALLHRLLKVLIDGDPLATDTLASLELGEPRTPGKTSLRRAHFSGQDDSPAKPPAQKRRIEQTSMMAPESPTLSLKALSPTPSMPQGRVLVPESSLLASDFEVFPVTPPEYRSSGTVIAATYPSTPVAVTTSTTSSQPESRVAQLPTLVTATAFTLFRPVGAAGKVTFTNEGQRKALEDILRADRDVLAILPTGSGKTALGLVPALLDQHLKQTRVTVYVTPSLVLKAEMVERCKQVGLPATVYPTEDAPDASALTGLLIVSAEVVATQACIDYVGSANVARYVVDEVHTFVTQRHFRGTLASIGLLRTQASPLILLSATMPPSMVDALGTLLQRPIDNVVRQSSIRRNISLDLVPIGDVDNSPSGRAQREIREVADAAAAVEALSALVARYLLQTSARGSKVLVFCKTKQEVIEAGQVLRDQIGPASVGAYHSPSIKAQNAHRSGKSVTSGSKALLADIGAIRDLEWFKARSSGMRVLVTTSALNQGMDNPDIHLVVFLGHPLTVTDYVQANGRLARTGVPSQSVVLYTSTSQWSWSGGAPSDIPWEVPSERKCLVEHFAECLDGPSAGTTCQDVYANISDEVRTALMCGNCRSPRSTVTTVDMALERLKVLASTPARISGNTPPPSVKPAPVKELMFLIPKIFPGFAASAPAPLVKAASIEVSELHARNAEIYAQIRCTAANLKDQCGWCVASAQDVPVGKLSHGPSACPIMFKQNACMRCFTVDGPNCSRTTISCGEDRINFSEDNQHCFKCALPVSLHHNGVIGTGCRLLPDTPLVVCHALLAPGINGRLASTLARLPKKLRDPKHFRSWLAKCHPSYTVSNAALLFLHIATGDDYLPSAKDLAVEFTLLNNRLYV